MRRTAGLFALLTIAAVLSAQAPEPSGKGEEAAAARYLAYALAAAEEGRWIDVETTLVRAADYSGVSSELSLLLARARRNLNRPIGSVIEATRRALEASRWTSQSADDARLLEAECLIDLRSFDEALAVLVDCAESPDSAFLVLRALSASGDAVRFLRRMKDSLAAFPRDTRFVRLLFKVAGKPASQQTEKRVESDEEQRLIAFALDRIPFLIGADPFLAVCAAPFVRNVEERRRLVAAYRAIPPVSVESVPMALSLGLVSDSDAVEELFAQSIMDVRLLTDSYDLLRAQDARTLFARKSAAFSGLITEDADGDSRPESRTRYERGEMVSFSYDADQDGIFEWDLRISDGLPIRGSIAISAESITPDSSVPVRVAVHSDLIRAETTWERYPYIASIAVGKTYFRFPPQAFPFAPVRLVPLFPGAAVRIPKTDPITPRMTERSFYSFASSVDRPGSLASGSSERIEYSLGAPIRSIETVKGATLAITQFEGGFPTFRRADLDLDGRFETFVKFKSHSHEVNMVETDFDGDGVFDKVIQK
ncbi:MAG: hypothetical protein WCT14_00710 [Treponemataceae bacterium]